MKYNATYKFGGLWLAMMMVSVLAISQSISVTADRDKILIGEQVTLLLKTDNITGITQWFNMPDTINHLEVVKRSKIDTIDIGGNKLFQQTLAITSFDSGHWQIPVLSVTTTTNDTYSSQPIGIDVVPVDVSQLQDYHDIKEIVEVDSSNSSYILVIIGAITLISLLVVYWLMKRKRTVVAPQPVLSGDLSPYEWAMQQLKNLEQEDLAAKGSVKQHYVRVSHIMRQYFHLQMHHRSLTKTTDEWIVKLQGLPVQNDTRISFLQLLRLADAVKFAKYIPPAAENEQSIKTARAMVKQVADLQYAGIQSPNVKS